MNKLKIAICFYGQPRHLEYTSKYLKKYYRNNEKYEFDFFCSAKSYYEWFSDKRNVGKIREENPNEIEKLITDVYSPKSLNIIPKKYDDICDADKIQKVYLSIIDSIFLKSKYEAESGIHYDVTILQRYDCILFPLEKTLDYIIKSLIDSKSFTNPNHVFHFKMGNGKEHEHLVKMIQDIFLFSIGNTLDILASELSNYIGEYNKKCRYENKNEFFIKNIHSIIFDIFSKNNVEMHTIDNSKSDVKIHMTLIRDGLQDLDILQPETWRKYVDLWHNTQKNINSQIKTI